MLAKCKSFYCLRSAGYSGYISYKAPTRGHKCQLAADFAFAAEGRRQQTKLAAVFSAHLAVTRYSTLYFL